MDDKTTHFGFKTVGIEKKAGLVKGIFDNVSSKYDLMNDAMSFGWHHIWKREMIGLLPNNSSNLLDVAGGTGDIAKLYYRKATKNGGNPSVTICDINYSMLSRAQHKLVDENLLGKIDILCADGEKLPFADCSFDYYTIAFGIRNVTNIPNLLKEAYRVLKPGGKFVCLEFSHVENPIMSKIYDFYSFQIIPRMGQCIASDREAYEYLVESIKKFPSQENFKKLILDAGFTKVNYRNMSFGVTALHYGYRI